ncbi:MAG: hypothetical protein Q7P63_15115 [Verrucomicrobiota bacterium JB022]|nr:hypothetical protein [Verrucomicrobiota bacterium JB022]
MNLISTFWFCFRLLALGILSWAATGCGSLTGEDPNMSPVPHAQPANWEGQVPGFNGMGGAR